MTLPLADNVGAPTSGTVLGDHHALAPHPAVLLVCPTALSSWRQASETTLLWHADPKMAMSIEQAVLETLRTLPPDKQPELLNFAEFLRRQSAASASVREDPHGSIVGLWDHLGLDITAEDMPKRGARCGAAFRAMMSNNARSSSGYPFRNLVIVSFEATILIPRAACDEARRVGDPILLPSISLVELRYLVDRGRFPESAFDLLYSAVARPDPILMLALLDLSVARMLRQIPRADVPDMLDRSIAATALARGLPPVSRDRQIRAKPITTIWQLPYSATTRWYCFLPLRSSSPPSCMSPSVKRVSGRAMG